MQRLRRWFRRAPHQFDPGKIVEPKQDNLSPIDGVEYSQPPIVPWHVDRGDSAKVTQYLEEVRSSYRFQFDGNRT